MFSHDPYAQVPFLQFLQILFGLQRPPRPPHLQLPLPTLTALQPLFDFQQRSLAAWFGSAGALANAAGFANPAAAPSSPLTLSPFPLFAASTPAGGLAALSETQRDTVRSAWAQATVFWREAGNAVNGTGVLFTEATEQMQGLFNRGPYKSLE